MNQRQKPRSYTYRIPLNDKKAMRKVRRLEILDSGYWIAEIPDRDVPNVNAVKNWAVKFYESKEHRDFETDKMVGGTIPGLHKYRYSLEWRPTPETELLEMKNASNGGTKIRGEKFVGTHDPRLPDYAPVSTTVPWTPTEIEAMFDGEPVPNKADYTHDHPTMDADMARAEYRRLIETAAEIGLEECERLLAEHVENCDHDHVLTTDRSYGDAAFCEDCGRGWDRHDFDYEKDDVTVVGTA